ncbi:MAG TPA: oligosaccharide flippase family protein [Deltaproteobacteria bacterium]|nr:oligosaccharide flippase family protein [Deltaproteobacteria bacterium]
MSDNQNHRFVYNVAKLASGNAFAQALAILITPLLTRLFEPSDFGVAALFISISAIITIISCMRYELSIMLPEDEGEAANLFFISLFSVLFITSLASAIIFFSHDGIVKLFQSQELGRYLWLLPLSILSNGIILAFNYWNARIKAFGRTSRAVVLSSATAQAAKISGGFLGYTTGGVLIGATVLGQALSAFYMSVSILGKDFKEFSQNITLAKIRQGVVRHKKFPLIDLWGALLNTVSWQLPALMLGAFFSPVIVGLYALGNSVIRAPINLIVGSIAQVFYQRTSEARNRGNIASVVERVFKRLVSFGLFPMFLLCFMGKDLFIVAFGKEWAEAGMYTQILAPWMFFTFISSPLSVLFSVYERQGTAMLLQSSIFLTRFASLYVGGIMGNVYVALLLYSISGIAVYGLFGVWNLALAQVRPSVFWSTIFKYGMFSLPAGVLMYLMKYTMGASPLAMTVASVLLISGYELYVVCNDKELAAQINLLRFARKDTTRVE